MKDLDCIQFLRWSLPKLRMRWQGFRKVRSQVCKRIDRRLRELGLPDVGAYRSYLKDNPDEWRIFDSFCRITISHFYRDREVFRFIERDVLTKLSEEATARGEKELRCWSIGCASGEEPYTLALIWNMAAGLFFTSLKIAILATDVDKSMIERAEEGCYASSSLKDLPPQWTASAFVCQEDRFCIRAEEREKVVFLVQDIRRAAPDGLFHVILCRNLAFTYFNEKLRKEVLVRMRDKLYSGGALVLGIHETLPAGSSGFGPWPGSPGVYRKK